MADTYHDATLGGSMTLCTRWPPEGETGHVDRYFFVWNRGLGAATFQVDETPRVLPSQAIICFTPGQVVSAGEGMADLVVIGFDRPFYCVETHDHEVSCNGLLFNGALGAPVVKLDAEEAGTFQRLLDVIEEEFHNSGTAQTEMLRLLLKRFIIICTRMARDQLLDDRASDLDVELVRQYSALVEKHFRTHRRVSDYADMLYRSPKTLANAFRTAGSATPQEILLDRVALEARRLLHYTDKPVQRIAGELGYDDPAHFSRFFKKRTGVSPVDFRRGEPAEPPLRHIGKS
jgi:AraC family 4-hydroxyphenylacetate 3-monooxygenase operon regulatory protein